MSRLFSFYYYSKWLFLVACSTFLHAFGTTAKLIIWTREFCCCRSMSQCVRIFLFAPPKFFRHVLTFPVSSHSASIYISYACEMARPWHWALEHRHSKHARSKFCACIKFNDVIETFFASHASTIHPPSSICQRILSSLGTVQKLPCPANVDWMYSEICLVVFLLIRSSSSLFSWIAYSLFSLNDYGRNSVGIS